LKDISSKKRKEESLGENQVSATGYSSFAIFHHHSAKTLTNTH
jgi:hypothetical protein